MKVNPKILHQLQRDTHNLFESFENLSYPEVEYNYIIVTINLIIKFFITSKEDPISGYTSGIHIDFVCLKLKYLIEKTEEKLKKT
jgi:hypothetical protein